MIRLEEVTHAYGSKKVVEKLSFKIGANELTSLLGNSGSGKSTILRLIAGLEKPNEGKIFLNDQLVTEAEKIILPPDKRNIGFIFQDLALWPHFSVYENVAFGLKIKKEKNVKDKVGEMLSFFDIKALEEKYPHQLSGGQQQLVALARCLVLKPDILLFDEPLSNLDVQLKARIIDHIKILKKEFKITVVYVTHDHREAFALADKIMVLNREGGIELSGSKEEISQSENAFVKSFISL